MQSFMLFDRVVTTERYRVDRRSIAYIFKHPGRQPFKYLVTYDIYSFMDNNFIFHFPLLILISTYSVEGMIVT